jgi:DNA-binding MarR family transcriptional regulator
MILLIDWEILTNFVEFTKWEWRNVPVLRTVVGQHVYFSIVTQMLETSNDKGARSIKQVLNHPGYTDRAIRLKLRELERMGLIESVSGDIDKRVRNVIPTPEFEQFVKSHAKAYRSLLEREFLLLKK